MNAKRAMGRLRLPLAVCIGVSLPVLSVRAADELPVDRIVQKHMVRISGARRLNMTCIGSGAPAVIFEQGWGAHILTWRKVAPEVAKFTTACVYDRAGEGFSDPSGRPATAENVVDDLHLLLKASGVPRPVILVGHSIGGLYATTYADKYLSDVAGLVLVDPSFSGQEKWRRTQKAVDGYRTSFEKLSALWTNCIAASEKAIVVEDNKACPWHFSPDRTAAVKAYLGYAFGRPYKYREELSEMSNFRSAIPGNSVDERQEDRLRRAFGATPLVVLTAGDPGPLDEGETPSDQIEERRMWREGHDRLAARSTMGKSILVQNASHFIQENHPETVISAIEGVVEMARGRRSVD